MYPPLVFACYNVLAYRGCLETFKRFGKESFPHSTPRCGRPGAARSGTLTFRSMYVSELSRGGKGRGSSLVYVCEGEGKRGVWVRRKIRLSDANLHDGLCTVN